MSDMLLLAPANVQLATKNEAQNNRRDYLIIIDCWYLSIGSEQNITDTILCNIIPPFPIILRQTVPKKLN